MERDGIYRQSRQRITQPVTRVPSSAVPPRPPESVRESSAPHYSSASMGFSKAAGWTIASLLIGLLGGVSWTMVTLFTREHQLQRLEEQQQQQQQKIEGLERSLQAMARRLVQLETEVEGQEPSK